MGNRCKDSEAAEILLLYIDTLRGIFSHALIMSLMQDKHEHTYEYHHRLSGRVTRASMWYNQLSDHVCSCRDIDAAVDREIDVLLGRCRF